MNLFGGEIQRSHFLLIGVCVVTLLLRLSLIDQRWLNPDEGAQMMDASLALNGYTPLVDYESRQPLYVYVVAGFLKVFGTTYTAGRLYGVTFSVCSGLLLYLLARSLFDQGTAMLATALYWMLPLEILQSTVAKTEPLNVFLTCLSLYLSTRFSRSDRKSWLFGAGAVGAMAFYVRQSSLVIPPIVLMLLLAQHGWRVREAAKHFGVFLAGYFAVVALLLAYYSRHMSSIFLLERGDLSPVGMTIEMIKQLTGWQGGSAQAVTEFEPANSLADPFLGLYASSLVDAVSLHSFLLVGLGLSLAALAYSASMRKQWGENSQGGVASVLLVSWVGFLLLAYAARYRVSGFFIDYFREFLPPLAIICAAWLRHSVPAFKDQRTIAMFVFWALCLGAVWFAVQSKFPIGGIGYLTSLAIAVFALGSFVNDFTSPRRRVLFVSVLVLFMGIVLVSREDPLKPFLSGFIPSVVMVIILYWLTWVLLEQSARPSLPRYALFMANSILMASFVVSISYSAQRLGLRYDNVWSPEAVKQVASYLREHTQSGEEVMSGAVIWEFEAARRPFQLISHPLAFARGMSVQDQRVIKAVFDANPPKVIILDGVTELTYLRNLSWLTERLGVTYRLQLEAGPGYFPVKVYQLIEG
jgi:4-amino-4-deoxy-L-arabinose transferase-like glycosyltransferase